MKAECVIDSSLDNDTLELRAITSCEIRRTKSASLAKFGRGEYHSTPQNGQRRGHPPAWADTCSMSMYDQLSIPRSSSFNPATVKDHRTMLLNDSKLHLRLDR